MVLLLIVVFIIGYLVGAKQEQKRILNKPNIETKSDNDKK